MVEQQAIAETDLRREVAMLLPQLRGLARFLARDRSEADDLVQEALLRALRSLAQFQPGTSVRAWLFTILRNVFYEQARRRRRERAAIAQQTPDSSVAAHQPHETDLADLAAQFRTLPPSLREALILVGAQELTYEEAAAICGVPVGTMKARVSRARRQLAALVEPPTAEPDHA
jgi:RNA polymerase sigma-70 factor (ECF subfamily)